MNDILVVDDERDIRELISDILQDEGFSTRIAATSEECMAELNKAAPGLMILDIWLKDSHMDGIDILGHVKRDNPQVPVVIISGHGNLEIAVAAIKQGAYDYIEKPFNIDQLMVVIRRAMETSRLRRENSALRRQDSKNVDMIGGGVAFRTMKGQLDKVTKSNGRIMLTGAAKRSRRVITTVNQTAPTAHLSRLIRPLFTPTIWKTCCLVVKHPGVVWNRDCLNKPMAE